AEHALPAGAVTRTRVAALAKALVAQRQPRATIDRFEQVSDCRSGTGLITWPPGLHELARRIELENFAFDEEWFAIVAHPFAAPRASDAQIGRELRRLVQVGVPPPVRELVGGERAEDALGGGRNVDGREDGSAFEIRDRTGGLTHDFSR